MPVTKSQTTCGQESAADLSRCVTGSAQEHVKREKAVMAEMSCDFTVALVAAFQDEFHLYLLQEAVMGGEFFTYMQSRAEPLPEDHVRFYAAAVVLGLEYMQNHDLVWRCAMRCPAYRARNPHSTPCLCRALSCSQTQTPP